jgi:hypothetical protein
MSSDSLVSFMLGNLFSHIFESLIVKMLLLCAHRWRLDNGVGHIFESFIVKMLLSCTHRWRLDTGE